MSSYAKDVKNGGFRIHSIVFKFYRAASPAVGKKMKNPFEKPESDRVRKYSNMVDR